MLSSAAWEKLRGFASVIEHAGDEPATHAEMLKLLLEADACLTSWGVAALDDEVLQAAPRLRMMAHMGSSVKRFVTDAVWARGMRVTSAAPALAEDVAITTLGLIITGMKHIWPLGQHVRTGGWRESAYWPSREIRHKNVGVVGASRVGRRLIRFLQPFQVHILLYDPYISDEQASSMGVEKVELAELLKRADILTLHAPATSETRHLITGEGLALLKDDALIVNTARGDLIDERALVSELSKGRFFAFLDVTDPEPPALDSPLRCLPNVVVVPHLAGCIEDCTHLGDMAVEELRRFFADEPALYELTPQILAHMS
ncbi:MAG: hydroxyacid dehydrogenase [Chloroflexi bacterium]|nr:hydroxyacid dehydrogenase [Chloroflexota bacterium]